MKRYESRYCTFAVPDDWEAEPPFAFREKGEGLNRLVVQVLERSLAKIPSALTYALNQKLILAELYEGFELIQEGAYPLGGLGEGYFFLFRFLDEDGYPAQGNTIYLTCGPLVVQFVLTGPDGENKKRDRLFEAIGKTFTFRQTEFLAGAKQSALMSDILHIPQTDVVKAWLGPRRKFPQACVALPVISGWETVEEERSVVFRRRNAEIRLHRALGENNESDRWFACRLQSLQHSGDRFLGSERGEIEHGLYTAVLYEERGAVRTWKTAAITRSLDVFLEGQQPLLWTLRASGSSFSDFLPLLGSLVVSADFLDPMDWETPLAEPWITYILKGFWESQGLGIYANMSSAPLILCVSQEKNRLALSTLKTHITDSLSQDIQAPSQSKEGHLGIWGQNEVFHLAVDGTSDDFTPLSLRSIWIQAEDTLHSIIIRGTEQEKVVTLHHDIIDSLLIPGLPPRKNAGTFQYV